MKENDQGLKQPKKKIKRAKSPLKTRLKADKTKPKMIVLGTTILLIIVTFLIYSISLAVAPQITLEANITAIRGGYSLDYTICQLPRHLFSDNIDVGDKLYLYTNGTPSRTAKNSVLMKIVEINNDAVRLEFMAQEIPTFIATTDFKNIIKDSSSGKQFRSVYVTGKIVGNRFILQKISCSKQH